MIRVYDATHQGKATLEQLVRSWLGFPPRCGYWLGALVDETTVMPNGWHWRPGLPDDAWMVKP